MRVNARMVTRLTPTALPAAPVPPRASRAITMLIAKCMCIIYNVCIYILYPVYLKKVTE